MYSRYSRISSSHSLCSKSAPRSSQEQPRGEDRNLAAELPEVKLLSQRHGLSVEAAEGLAEFIHKQIRAELGIAGEDAREMKQLFQQGYRGSRFSFGYPACPRMEDQEQLLALLGAEKLGITLSEEFQLVPEQSTSAIVCHHPSAKYFTI